VRYFKLRQDERLPNSVRLTGDYHEARNGDLSNVDSVIVSLVNSSPLNFYPDIISGQLFMVKGAVKQVFDMFLPKMQYKHCVMIDEPENKYEQYYIPVLDVFDVSEVSKAVASGRQIFRVISPRERAVVASLAAVEAVLRRSPAGIKIDAITPGGN